MNRLVEIQNLGMLAAAKDRVYLSREDILALVAVAQAGHELWKACDRIGAASDQCDAFESVFWPLLESET